MAERQAKEGMTLQSVAKGGILDLIDARGQVKANLTPTEIVRLLEAGVKRKRGHPSKMAKTVIDHPNPYFSEHSPVK